jgi:cell division protein FtsW (lipid II flippase)
VGGWLEDGWRAVSFPMSTVSEAVPAVASPRRPVPRRRTELGLLALAALITVFAYVLASLGQQSRIPAHLGPFLGVVLGLGLVAHLANRRLAPMANPVFLPIASLLNGIGYVFVARLDHHQAQFQAEWSVVGVVAYIATLAVVRRSRDLDRYRYLLLLVGLGLLLTPLVPHFGENINGERLWVHFGPLSFQPVELAKLALVVFFASYFTEKRELLSMPTMRVGNRLLPDPRTLGPIFVAWGFSLLIMTAERDIGFSLLIFVVFVAMLWLATGRVAYLVLGAVLFALGAFVAAHLFAQVGERISVWLDPWKQATTNGYQPVQGLYALGSGGLTGTGLGLGHPNLIPVVTSDYIFAAIGEELGLVGTTAVVVAFVVLVGTGLRVALAARSEFIKLLAAGFTLTIGLQAFFIMAGIVRVLPLTGVTLPFVAYGGSSLLANYILVALLVRASNESDGALLLGAAPGP